MTYMTTPLHKNCCPLGNENGLFVCLFVRSFSSQSRIFHSFGDVTITGEGLQILTYALRVWPLNSEGSLACLTYCDMGHPFIMVISLDAWHSHLLPSVWQWSCHYLYWRLRYVAAGIRTPNLPLWPLFIYIQFAGLFYTQE